jgi:Fe-S-cluster-containing hydrogenase component 2
VRIDRDCFRGLLTAVPALKAEVLQYAARRLQRGPRARREPAQRISLASSEDLRSSPPAPLEQTIMRSERPKPSIELQAPAPLRREFVDQGLYNAQRLLVLDLEACTRCDECTKACSDTHDGITRLIREGLRIDKWLVASSCRSCSDPYCLVGCPVDAIHRDGQGKQIQIESHCIGCGLSANNCPYGNINMHPRPKGEAAAHRDHATCAAQSSAPPIGGT